MSVLSDIDIKRELGKKVIIEPFNESNLGNCSYDVTLGKYFYRTQHLYGSKYNMFNEKCVKNTWTLCTAVQNLNSTDGIKWIPEYFNGNSVIIIYPRETILCHTNEFIGGVENVTTMMKARSSIGRNFLEVCKCAGWGDVGYTNRWTMEITNNSDYIIPLLVGMRIAQIVFMYTGEIEKSYLSKYQKIKSIEELKEKWEPSEMLPKIYLDNVTGKKEKEKEEEEKDN